MGNRYRFFQGSGWLGIWDTAVIGHARWTQECGEVAKNDKIDRRIRRRIITAFLSVQPVFYTCHPTTISSYNGLFYLPTLTHTRGGKSLSIGPTRV
ncbi:unnamed protein product [Sphenostylis stenocarpa]|uniref:Uncharacterized protein n=1 Tax=Sphenostylis stenocarpa TaxID=92480 RepID=A0AA86S1T5_9FABA|nr:unnamed protein product [Sphenostylis stenocarpa]